MRAEKYPASSETFQTISQVEIPGPGFPGSRDDNRIQPLVSSLYPWQSQDTPSHSCSSSHPSPHMHQLHPTGCPRAKINHNSNQNQQQEVGWAAVDSRWKVNSVCTPSAQIHCLSPPQASSESQKGMLTPLFFNHLPNTGQKLPKEDFLFFKFLWRYYKHVDLKEHLKFLVTI